MSYYSRGRYCVVAFTPVAWLQDIGVQHTMRRRLHHELTFGRNKPADHGQHPQGRPARCEDPGTPGADRSGAAESDPAPQRAGPGGSDGDPGAGAAGGSADDVSQCCAGVDEVLGNAWEVAARARFARSLPSRAAGRTQRSGHWWRSRENWPCSCISCGSAEKYTNLCMSAVATKR